MPNLALHHVAICVTDLERSVAFYQDIFALKRIERPPFKVSGAWLECGNLTLHLILHPEGTFRTGDVDTSDVHFAMRTDDFDGVLRKLVEHGFREDAEATSPQHLVVIRDSVAGFPQLYLRDPDRNIVEVNGAR